jgi:hypothetical protein
MAREREQESVPSMQVVLQQLHLYLPCRVTSLRANCVWNRQFGLGAQQVSRVDLARQIGHLQSPNPEEHLPLPGSHPDQPRAHFHRLSALSATSQEGLLPQFYYCRVRQQLLLRLPLFSPETEAQQLQNLKDPAVPQIGCVLSHCQEGRPIILIRPFRDHDPSRHLRHLVLW